MNRANASGVELWNAFHRPLSNRRQADQLAALLGDLLPGTAIEGYWLPTLGRFLANDITFLGQEAVAAPAGHIAAYRPVKPENANKAILTLPPDDWRLEPFLSSDKVVAIAQPDRQHWATDLRQRTYEQRLQILREVVAGIDHPGVGMLPGADGAFHQAYEAWKLHDFSEGVVVRNRHSSYPGIPGHMRRHLYEWAW